MKKPQFKVDWESFQSIQEEVGIGQIKELPLEDASMLAKHNEPHPDTLYVASSAVNLSNQFGVFESGYNQVAIEWIRHETNPKAGEPECNTYRYLFGITSDKSCIGLDVTQKPETGQVADHWTSFDEAVNRHFPS
jgi:hypothetical protein